MILLEGKVPTSPGSLGAGREPALPVELSLCGTSRPCPCWPACPLEFSTGSGPLVQGGGQLAGPSARPPREQGGRGELPKSGGGGATVSCARGTSAVLNNAAVWQLALTAIYTIVNGLVSQNAARISASIIPSGRVIFNVQELLLDVFSGAERKRAPWWALGQDFSLIPPAAGQSPPRRSGRPAAWQTRSRGDGRTHRSRFSAEKAAESQLFAGLLGTAPGRAGLAQPCSRGCPHASEDTREPAQSPTLCDSDPRYQVSCKPCPGQKGPGWGRGVPKAPSPLCRTRLFPSVTLRGTPTLPQ